MTRDPARIEPGVYRLVRTVENPKPDMRSRRDWSKLPRWARDRQFVVFGDAERLAFDDEDLAQMREDAREALRTKMIPNGYQRIQSVGEPHVHYIAQSSNLEQWNALVSALEAVAVETWAAFWMRIDAHRFLCDDFVRWLVAKGHITREQLEAEFAEWEAEPEGSKWREAKP